MLHAFVYNDTAILVRHWFEVSLKDSHLEHGVRLELRLREPQSLRGSESAAQRIVVRLVRAHDVLRRMPEPVPAAKIVAESARGADGDFEKQIVLLARLGAESDDARADRGRDRQFEGAGGEHERLAAAVISLRAFHG